MSSHHDQDNHQHEAKPVAFGTPLILALVTILILLVAVSTCNKKHDEHAATEAHETESAVAPLEAVETDEHTAVTDTTVKAEEHAHH